jgi:hypothetical protein
MTLFVASLGPGPPGVVFGKIDMTAGPVPHMLQALLFAKGYPSIRCRISSGPMNPGLFLFQPLGFSPCNLTGSNPLFDTDLLILMAVIRLLAG